MARRRSTARGDGDASRTEVPEDEERRIHAEYRQSLYFLRKMQGAYGRFVPRDFLKLLGAEDILNVRLGDEVEKKITVMFSDIRDFTTLSETMTSRQVFEFLNDYLSHMEPAVQGHGGIVDKYIGDAVMALFPDRADDAVKAAIAMRDALRSYNQGRRRSGQPPIETGIGLNTGLTTLGILGHLERMESTIIGDAVNVAQRIEGLTKIYRAAVLISEDTLAALNNAQDFSIRFVDRVRVKGRARPISIYEVFDGDHPDLARAKLENVDQFENAVAYYHLREVDKALPLFEACKAAARDDSVVEVYLDRCRRFLDDGTFEGPGELLDHLEWREAYDTKIEEIDTQHRVLLENINALSAAIKTDDVARIDAVFAFIERYCIEHFRMEGAYMRKYGYPFAAEHGQEHAAFIRAFARTREEAVSGRATGCSRFSASTCSSTTG